MNFVIQCISYFDMHRVQNTKKTKQCTGTAALTPVPRWSFMDPWKRWVRHGAWEDSVSTA